MDWYLTIALILIGFGVVLLVAEFFLPTGGVLVVSALGLFAVAVGLILLYGTTEEGIAAVIGLCIGIPIAGAAMFYGWQRLSLKGGLDPESGSTTVIDTPEISELEHLRGRVGKTISPMRPSGTVEIDGRRVDAMTEGMMIDADVWVKCIDVRVGRVIVRKVDAPGDLSNLDLNDLK